MTIYALFFEKYKCLMKGDYRKTFDVSFDIKGLKKMLSEIRVAEKTVIVVKDTKLYSKIRFSLDFDGYEIARIPDLDEKCRNKDFEWLEKSDDYVMCRVKKEWQGILGKEVAICIDRAEQVKLVNELDVCAFQATDVNNLVGVLSESNALTPLLIHKMFFTDNEIKEMGFA